MIVDGEDADLNRFHWSINKDGYAVRHEGPRETQVCVSPHRVILSRMLGRPLRPDEHTDHANHDKLDNRRCNIRLVNIQQNNQNRGGPQKNGTSWFRGVTRYRDGVRWVGQVGLDGKHYHCGLFATPEQAADAATAMRKRLGFLEKQG
jgi:hypothetical protein